MSTTESLLQLVLGLAILCASANGDGLLVLEFDEQIPQIAFAAEEIRQAANVLTERAAEDAARTRVILSIDAERLRPQCYEVRRDNPGVIRVVGGDAVGAMYGGLEVAECIRLERDLRKVPPSSGEPYIQRRGLKFNIPLDARAPSYDDTGDAAQQNVATVWEFDFWREFLDDMARHRYNVLTLWSTHPYPTLLPLDDYPGVAYDDVRVLTVPLDHTTDRHWNQIDIMDPKNTRIVKRMTIAQKMQFWQRVMQYAADRGIEIYLFHWNIHMHGALGKHGISHSQEDPDTVRYLRYCVKELLLTYPQIKGIGVTAGERVNRKLKGEHSIENWMWRTYGQGIMDAKAENPELEIRFIFRRHWSDLGEILQAFKDFDGPIETGMKYARARIYTTTKPPFFDAWYRQECEKHNVKCWMNLRNDDIFCLRWGNPDYVRQFLENLPHDLLAGFYMGPDGYVWGREFISRDPHSPRQLEIRKHWYRFMLWGRLAYDPRLDRSFFEKVLAARFPGVDAPRLYDAWASASSILSPVNQIHWYQNDLQWAPEGCFDMREGFHDVNRFINGQTQAQFLGVPRATGGVMSIREYVNAVDAGETPDGVTPFETAEALDRMAEAAIRLAGRLRKDGPDSKELRDTLADIESLGHLGSYYADKIRGATELLMFRTSGDQSHQRRAVGFLKEAVTHWEAYAGLTSARYKPQLLARTRTLDWQQILEDVKRDVGIARRGTPGDAR